MQDSPIPCPSLRQAALLRRYGPPEAIRVETQLLPPRKPGLVPVQVLAAAVTVGDARIRAARAPGGLGPMLRLAFGLTGPRQPVLGMFFCGRQIEPAPGLAAGSRVMGNTGMAMGAHATHLQIDPARLRPVPESLGAAEAAALMFGGLTAADFLLDKAALRPGQSLLVNGATGEVGCAALQIARHLGLVTTAICRAANHEFARGLGASACHDYRQGPPQGRWDGILDLAGTLPYARSKALLAPGGVLMPATASLGAMLGGALRPRRGTHRITPSTTDDGPKALDRLLDLHRQGAIRPVVSAHLSLDQIAQAHALCDSGHKRGSVVVVMAADDRP